MKAYKVLLMAVYNENMKDIYEEIGIASIASYLRQNGYEVKLIGAKESKVDYTDIIHFKPDIIGLTMYTISKNSVYTVSKKLKELLPDVKILVGGCLPTYYSSEILKESDAIDYAIRGEGEIACRNLLKALEDGEELSTVRGLTYRKDNEIQMNEDEELIKDLDILPSPARDIVQQNKLRIAQISSSRGCRGRCSFCMSHEFWKDWRGRNIKVTVDEIEDLVKNYNVTTFDFIDGSMEDPDPGLKRLTCFATEIVNRNLNISFYADCRAEFHRKATPEAMHLLKQAGLCGVCIGIETGNETDLRLYRKMATTQDNQAVVEFFRKYDIFVDPGFINFNPYSTIEGLRSNIDYLEKNEFACRVDHIMSRYRMFKNTFLTNKLTEDGLLIEGAFDDELRYHYVNNNIEGLSRFLHSYVNSFAKIQNEAFYGFNYYAAKFYIILIHYKRTFGLKQLEQALEFAKRTEQNNKEICAEVNKMIAQWFRQLVDLAELGWDDMLAKEISDKALFKEYDMVSIYNSLIKNRNEFYLNLFKLGSEYESYIVDFSLN